MTAKDPDLANPAVTRATLLTARCIVEGTPPEQAATLLGVPVEQARRAIGKMRQEIERRAAEDEPNPVQQLILHYMSHGPGSNGNVSHEQLVRAFGEDQIEYVTAELRKLQSAGIVRRPQERRERGSGENRRRQQGPGRRRRR